MKTNHKYTALIVEPRKHGLLELVLNNFSRLLDEEWRFVIFHGTQNETFLKEIIQKIPNRHFTLYNLNVDNLRVMDYNKLFYSKNFYEYIPTETFLIFQTDTLLSDVYKDYINDFLEYDYVGAPWGDGCVGNGGLSLRKKSKMLEVLDKCDHLKWEYTNKLHNEDIFFSRVSEKMVDLHKPPFEKAKLFSIETVYSDRSFGTHFCWGPGRFQNDKEKLLKICEFIPDLKKVLFFDE